MISGNEKRSKRLRPLPALSLFAFDSQSENKLWQWLFCLWLSGFAVALLLLSIPLKGYLFILALPLLCLIVSICRAVAVRLSPMRDNSEMGSARQADLARSAQAALACLEADLLLRIAAQEASEQKFKLLCDMAPLGIYMTDETGACVYSNSRLEEITGLRAEDGLGWNWIQSIHPDDRDWLLSANLAAIYENKEYSFEHRMLSADGRLYWVRVLGRPIKNGDGDVTGYVGTIEDITERKKAQATSRLLSGIVESSNDAIVSRSRKGVITSWNKAAADMFGYKPGEALGLKFAALVPEACRQELLVLVKGVEEGQIVRDHETLIVAKDGSITDASLTVSPVMDEQGLLSGVSVIIRDISQRKEMDKRISEFYSTISHELRTPLTSIRGALSLIDEGIVKQESEAAGKLIKVARSSSVRLVRLVNDILDLRKIEAGRLELCRQPVYVAAVVEQAVESMQAFAAEMNISLTNCAKAEALLEIDSDRLTQVLSNLIQNAIKFSPEGSCVEVVSSLKDSKVFRCAICDHGAGISASEQKKLFTRFQQLDSSDSRGAEGTGLGLAISKAIIDEHGGAIGVESVPGNGSTFWFELPLLADKGASEQSLPEALVSTVSGACSGDN